ncbi:MAG: shikimate dehydrogenase [Salinibacterium sp.]|nr:shikimate dehydrogenase [Salinibacterium sp.]
MTNFGIPRASATRLAVLGSPIEHSLSPAIHRAAYTVLGVNWSYAAAEVTAGDLSRWVNLLDQEWRGLSLTMPLKREILPMLAVRHPLVDVVGAANTVLMTANGLAGFNTDVFGIVSALRGGGVTQVGDVHMFGSGATAASALVALAQLGARKVTVEARTVANASPLLGLAESLEIEVVVKPFGNESLVSQGVDIVVSTMPGGAVVTPSIDQTVRERALLFDVVYSPWPSPMAREWLDVGGRVVSGLEMLLLQAVGQVSGFLAGAPDRPLLNESAVLGAMRAAVN